MPTKRLFPDVETPNEKHERARSGPEGLKPFFLDSDRHVRESVRRYFTESYSQDPDLLGLVLDGCEQFGDMENGRVLVHASRLDLSREDFVRVVERLSEAEDYNICAHYEWILASAPIEWIVEQKNRLEETGKLTEGPAKYMNRRLTYMGVSPEEVWEELKDYSYKSRNSKTTDGVDHSKVNCLLDILAHADVPEDERVVELLQEDDVQEEWLEIWLVKLAGQRRIASAVPQLVKRLQLDTGYLRERIDSEMPTRSETKPVSFCVRFRG